MSWLDYQQIGMKPLPQYQVMLLAAIKAPISHLTWIYFTIQYPNMQMNGTINTKSGLRQFAAGHVVTAAKLGNIWVKGRPAQYNQPCTIQLLSTYPHSTVPSSIRVTIANAGTFILKSYSETLPLLVSAEVTFLESPSSVTQEGRPDAAPGLGVIEWVPADMYPSTQQALAGAGLGANMLNASNASPAAQAALSLLILAILLGVTLIVVGCVLGANSVRKKRQAQRTMVHATPAAF
jgi:hypothetical protein